MGGSDQSRHQVNSKWKDLQKKCNAFNGIYNRKMSSAASGRSEVDVLQSSLSEYRRTINQKEKTKSKKAASTSSTENEMFDLVKQIVGIKTTTETEAEQRQRYREQKLCILEANEERKAQLLDREYREPRYGVFFRRDAHLTGGILHTVLERKRQIATKHGWELEDP
ncbi:unnamed protein product [Lactuca virosa]|nr:unnamed protein product [Lactuca virosa]